jgi:predicted metallo-beta-lactamase superfamily hydrolase
MKIIPLAFDSLGVRSMATGVETDLRIIIDPGAALEPSRYNLPPSKIELQRLEELSKKICEFAERAEIIIITHYHYDHHFPEEDFYKDKILFLKHPKEKINLSQKQRAKEFLELLEKNPPQELIFAEGKESKIKNTVLRFSSPVFHGEENSKLGYVIMCSIQYQKEKLIFASDIQGPQTDSATDWIIGENPDILILSGFPTLFLGWKASLRGLESSNNNIIKILEKTKVQKVILEHHLVRDLHYQKKVEKVFEKAQELKKEILTAAEFLGKKPEFLEARRKELWQSQG